MSQVSQRIAMAMLPVLVLVLVLFSVATAAREGEVIQLEMQRDADTVAATVAALLQAREADVATLEQLDEALHHLTIELVADPGGAVPSAGEVVGTARLEASSQWVVVREPLAERDAFVRRALVADSLGVLAATLVAWAFAAAVGRQIVERRVVVLIERLRAVGSGDFGGAPLALGSDEIGSLGRAVEEMSEQLLDARRRVGDEQAGRRRAQLQLRRSDRLASVGRMVAVFAHEIGTPLAVVAGRAQRLQREEHAEKVRSDARVIHEQAGRITAFVRRILDYARHDDSLEFQAVDVSASVRAAQQLAVEHARSVGVEVVLVDDAPGCIIDGDAQALVQVLTNLLRNAVDASPPGAEVTVTVERVMGCDGLVDADEGHLHLTVADEGPGIPEALRERVFDPFFTTKPAGEGTGLGLSIVAEIVQDHGGRVTLEPSEEGCRVVVHLPIAGGSHG